LILRLRDPNWRLTRLYKITNKSGDSLLFRPNYIQQRINKNTAKKKRILKARQFGVSTNEILKQFDKTIWTPNFTSCILADKRANMEKLFRIVHRAYDSMPPEFQPIVDRGGGSKHELYFPKIDSRIYCAIESRSNTINWLHASETAFIEQEERLKATLEAVPLDGIVTEETTPNGMGNAFYDRWHEPDSNYANLFFPWYLHYEYQVPCKNLVRTEDEIHLAAKVKVWFGVTLSDAQINFRRIKKRDLKDLFIQEYPEDEESCFLSSGDAALDLVLVADKKLKSMKPIYDSGGVKKYKEYDRSKQYVVGCDTAEGVGGDYSVAQVFEQGSCEQVAILRGQLKPSDFAHKINDLCKAYNTSGRIMPELAVERNNHGHAVILELNEHIGYPNMYRAKDERLGWLTDRVTRPIMINAFIDGVENGTMILHDQQTFAECLTLVNNSGKIEAAASKQDDCITSAAIALQLCIESGGLSVYDNLENRMLV